MDKAAQLLAFLVIATCATAEDRDVTSWANLERLLDAARKKRAR